jgi:23S rRNA pseudouridine1911/1915/1917 synthase
MRIVARIDETVLDLLQARFPQASKTTLRQMLRHRRVTRDGRVVSRADIPVEAGQVIEIAAAGRESAPDPPGRIHFRDAHLIAIEKPAGLLSVARDPVADDTFYRRVHAYVRESSGGHERIFIVHRLDREASGIMLFALSPEIQEKLQRNWADTEKRYWAVVEGRPPEETGTIRSWLRENRAHRVYSGPRSPEAKLAVTHYRVRQTVPGRALLDVRIETGRKNQIRAHLSELGCPVVGDRKYGARTNPIRRLGLHAFLLAFTHPVSGERIRLRLPLPSAFRIE